MNDEKNLRKSLSVFIESLFYKGDLADVLKLPTISFERPLCQTGKLHPETYAKFIHIFGIPLKCGIYGPFYRYIPNLDNLESDNEKGGYFSDALIKDCIGCVKKKLWLFNKNKKYFYEGTTVLYRFNCHFIIKNDEYSTVFIGEVAYGDAIQIRPNNYILDTERTGNRIVYRLDGQLNKEYCSECEDFIKSFK